MRAVMSERVMSLSLLNMFISPALTPSRVWSLSQIFMSLIDHVIIVSNSIVTRTINIFIVTTSPCLSLVNPENSELWLAVAADNATHKTLLDTNQ